VCGGGGRPIRGKGKTNNSKAGNTGVQSIIIEDITRHAIGRAVDRSRRRTVTLHDDPCRRTAYSQAVENELFGVVPCDFATICYKPDDKWQRSLMHDAIGRYKKLSMDPGLNVQIPEPVETRSELLPLPLPPPPLPLPTLILSAYYILYAYTCTYTHTHTPSVNV
jgi:hypothetical protein